MKELTIEIRKDTISIQGAGIGNDLQAAKKILQQALKAIDTGTIKSAHTNELVFSK